MAIAANNGVFAIVGELVPCGLIRSFKGMPLVTCEAWSTALGFHNGIKRCINAECINERIWRRYRVANVVAVHVTAGTRLTFTSIRCIVALYDNFNKNIILLKK